ncbi:hypothetical protein Bsp3421_000138 (plasmid) [Burkholderia sp. FERM BP-3421]|uniref:hypothetical protein n=1 Tax=Burkholderia sp. FERM BP-3421 TaxID=1494466 RepID=UPI00235EF8D9|nr:hypothetical protein [Burkholderia sp. FERM BP-3421]WDD90313.1 hypothetical protein Bsp3421_000138 [Burkholderia sp. FERM BP-3421]
MSARQTWLAALQVALREAVARDFAGALLIDDYADRLPNWAPRPGQCHAQVARWIAAHPDDHAVRGWLADGEGSGLQRFVAHSLVRTARGALLDVAFPTPAYPQIFIPHPAAAGDFLALVHGEPPLPWIDIPLPERS